MMTIAKVHKFENVYFFLNGIIRRMAKEGLCKGGSK